MNYDCYWEDLPEETLHQMQVLGNFGPTVNVKYKEIKGCMDEGKTYFDSTDLRKMAEAFTHVANWLDRRAEKEQA
jgi:hypothetical protein